MAAGNYGALVGAITAAKADPTTDRSPHFELNVDGGAGAFRAAVNIRSDDGSNLLVHIDNDYATTAIPQFASLLAGPAGFTAIATGPAGAGLDYVRGGLFPLDAAIATDEAAIAAAIAAAAGVDGARAVIFGRPFADRGADPVFGFSPERGIHDIHMMQGNSGRFAHENEVRGDGALFVVGPDGRVFALFARFDTQAIVTDPTTGAPR